MSGDDTWLPAIADPSTCILIASKDGAATIGATIDRCRLQADVYVVSDGSGDDTVEVARRHGAEVLGLDENVGKPNAIRVAYDHFSIAERYDTLLILDDDTRLADDFVASATAKFDQGVAVVCGETRSDWLTRSAGTGSSERGPSPTGATDSSSSRANTCSTPSP